MSFVPRMQQEIRGNLGPINIVINVEVSATEAEALSDATTRLPTLAAVQNTITLLVSPLFRTLALIEGGGVEQLIDQGPRTALPASTASDPNMGHVLKWPRPIAPEDRMPGDPVDEPPPGVPA